MKNIFCTFALSATILLSAGCGRNEPIRKTSRPVSEVEASVGHGAAGHGAAGQGAGNPAAAGSYAGKVVETMDAAGYTYVQVDTGSEKIWAAAPQFQVKVGDQVVVPKGMPMRDYHSKTLDRNFPLVYFAQSIANHTSGAPAQGAPAKGAEMPGGHPPISTAAEIDVSGIEKVEGGHTIGELYAGKADLVGKQVSVRGKVVKFSARIMGKNWLHLRDGSGDADAGTNDLTVTTSVAAKAGDTVTVSGKLAIDKDFGYGYKYDVIVEDAQVTVAPGAADK